ncbi:hypothetical protein ACSBR1_029536 [Camellia fascicularis]
MEVATESTLFNPSTFFPRSNSSFLAASHPQIRLATTNFPTNLRFSSRIPTNCIVPSTRNNLFSSRFQQNQGFVCRFQQSEVHGAEDSITSLKLGFFENQRTIVLAATVVGVLVFGCRGVFAVEGVVDSGYGVIGQNILLLKSYWRKLSQVRELAEKESEDGIFKMLSIDVTRFLTTMLIGTTVVNIGATAPVTKVATTIFREAGVSAATGVMTVAVLLLTEITPKSIAVHNATEVARFVYLYRKREEKIAAFDDLFWSLCLERLPWKNLGYIDLHSNLLRGPLPVPPNTTYVFSISNNKLTGEIPTLICNLSSLHVLDLSNNNLSGLIPQCLGNSSNSLSVLNLGINSFRGTFTATFTKGNVLRNLNLNGNQIEGQVPRSLLNCRHLEVLDVGKNKINDIFPHWLGTLRNLQVLVLRFNMFHGPTGTFKTKGKHPFPKLRIIDISYNEFIGLLPTNYVK